MGASPRKNDDRFSRPIESEQHKSPSSIIRPAKITVLCLLFAIAAVCIYWVITEKTPESVAGLLTALVALVVFIFGQ